MQGAVLIPLLVMLGAGSAITVEIPSLGAFRVVAHKPKADGGDHARVVFRDPADQVVGDFTLDMGGGSATQVALRALDIPERAQPIVLTVGYMLGADGVRIQAALFGFDGPRVRPLLPVVVHLEAEDAFCIGDLGPGQSRGVAAIRSFSAGECFVCWPKRFEAVMFSWSGDRLLYSRTLRTRGRHKTWQAAAAAVGLACTDQIGPTVFDRTPADGDSGPGLR